MLKVKDCGGCDEGKGTSAKTRSWGERISGLMYFYVFELKFFL